MDSNHKQNNKECFHKNTKIYSNGPKSIPVEYLEVCQNCGTSRRRWVDDWADLKENRHKKHINRLLKEIEDLKEEISNSKLYKNEEGNGNEI